VKLAHPGRKVVLARSGPGEGEWDGGRLAQVVTNLVNNAHNQGEPIPPKLLPHLFQPMTRGTGKGSTGRSIGLGLYIVCGIVRAHGGSIAVHSTASQGTAFTVSLPRPVRAQGWEPRSSTG
jgi:signal transduction histidine kinase